jgi:hypothetical protein
METCTIKILRQQYIYKYKAIPTGEFVPLQYSLSNFYLLMHSGQLHQLAFLSQHNLQCNFNFFLTWSLSHCDIFVLSRSSSIRSFVIGWCFASDPSSDFTSKHWRQWYFFMCSLLLVFCLEFNNEQVWWIQWLLHHSAQISFKNLQWWLMAYLLGNTTTRFTFFLIAFCYMLP